MQEGRAREDEILLRLTTITNAASSAVEEQSSSGAIKSEASPTAFPKESLASSRVNLPLPVDDLRSTWSHHHSDKMHDLKMVEGERSEEQGQLQGNQIKARTSTTGRKSIKSQGGVSRKSLAKDEMKQLKDSTGYQSGGSEMTAGWQSQCDVVIFPRSAVQVRIANIFYYCSVQLYIAKIGVLS